MIGMTLFPRYGGRAERFFILLVALSAFVVPASAAGFFHYNLDRPDAPSDFERIITKITNYLFTLLLLLAVAFIIIAAYRYLTSQGEPDKVKEATRMLTYALVAVIVAFLSKGIVIVVVGLFAR